ncbi:uncharacterized protein [Rutidosis leptorrhynchoides]|uniref:uncharacterized protein n=1 Tax=Rutidosis leptorrhynchoides TaxID=125765 RepID=UPI003A98D2EE
MKCVSTTSYSININGELHGYFKGKRGLRQGDPLSPYLFTFVMELLTLILKRNVRMETKFRYHARCEKLKIINLCFADDLFIFSHANVSSVSVIRDSLEEFKRCSGLVSSLPKSTCFFANVSNILKTQLIEIMPFDEGHLSVRYLGVPWRLLSNKESLWIQWVHTHKLADKHFWNVQITANASRKLLLIRGFSWYDKLSDIMDLNSWKQPNEWLTKYPQLQEVRLPVLTDSSDGLLWIKEGNSFDTFDVQKVWNNIRPFAYKVDWYSLVWFSQAIPWHAFLVRLVMGERLKTRDKLKASEIHNGVHLVCSLCQNCMDTHDHLFFECSFSQQVWSKATHLSPLQLPQNWKSIRDCLIPCAKRNTVNVVSKLLFATSIYFLWQERNNMLFKEVSS